MKKTIYNPTDLAPPIGHFERAVRFGDWLFVSGTSAATNTHAEDENDQFTRTIVEGIEAQTHSALDSIEKALAAAGGTLDQIYEIRMIMRIADHYPVVDRILRERLPKGGFIAHGYQGGLLHPAMEIEIEVNAYLGELDGEERVGRP